MTTNLYSVVNDGQKNSISKEMALREKGYESEVCCIHYNITLYILFLHKII